MPTKPDTFVDVDISAYDTSSGGSSGGGGSSSGTDRKYSPRFSSAANRDPHLSASKEVELKKGTLLGSEFKVK